MSNDLGNKNYGTNGNAMKVFLSILFLATVPLANWLIHNIGVVCVPNGPCLLPVAPGIMAPSGVLVIGATIVLRNILQELVSKTWMAGCILVGVWTSVFIAPVELALASGIAFGIAEITDWAVYTPLRKNGFKTALLVSGIVGAVVDSSLFVFFAFGSFHFVEGQIIGKLWATIIAITLLSFLQKTIKSKEISA